MTDIYFELIAPTFIFQNKTFSNVTHVRLWISRPSLQTRGDGSKQGEGVSHWSPSERFVFFPLRACVDDVDKLWLQRGSAHQEAVHVALRRQLSAVSSRHRTWRVEEEENKTCEH